VNTLKDPKNAPKAIAKLGKDAVKTVGEIGKTITNPKKLAENTVKTVKNVGKVAEDVGKRIGFAGREARGVMSDWARSARDGRYEPGGVDQDLEQGMADLTLPVLAVRMADDWFVPAASFDWLLGKLRRCEITTTDVAAASSGELSDHYRWMRRPERTVAIIESWLSGHGSQRSAPDAC